MGMNNLPALRNRNLARRVQEAAARRDAFVQKAGALRKANGKKETRTLSCVCVRTGQHFSVIFDRISENHNFQVSRIEKHEKSIVKKLAVFESLIASSASAEAGTRIEPWRRTYIFSPAISQNGISSSGRPPPSPPGDWS
jgi:hypothetical protein